ncbi:helix-turn-helix domain-containing protein, partial [Ochrobactrum sp. SFR4]|uniref:helix-turn-helix domain-containing protein n=1 Tax=Ochrobactrum sp. SFR4 TaxID=2717368 RepID=UPI002570E40D
MQIGLGATPFGGRPMTLALVQANRDSSNKVEEGKSVDKWQLYRDLCEAKSMFPLNDRALAV